MPPKIVFVITSAVHSKKAVEQLARALAPREVLIHHDFLPDTRFQDQRAKHVIRAEPQAHRVGVLGVQRRHISQPTACSSTQRVRLSAVIESVLSANQTLARLRGACIQPRRPRSLRGHRCRGGLGRADVDRLPRVHSRGFSQTSAAPSDDVGRALLGGENTRSHGP